MEITNDKKKYFETKSEENGKVDDCVETRRVLGLPVDGSKKQPEAIMLSWSLPSLLETKRGVGAELTEN